MLISLAFSILMVLVVLIDCLEDSEITGLPRELDRPNVQPARALRWYTSHKSFDATVSSDCSGSMMPTRLGKVRARRGDKCAIREGGPILPDYKPPVNTHRESIPWEIPAPFRIPVYDPIFNGRNPLCVIHTHGRLPLAVCDSGDINQRYDSDQDMFTYFLESSYQAPTYRLEYCTLAPPLSNNCLPPPSAPWCCKTFEIINGVGYADVCLLFDDLQ